jgi:hypothetical protein
MNILRSALQELIGMFIDDGALALFSIVLVGVIAAAVELAGLPGFAGGILLLVGCIVILAESTYRAARRKIGE